MELHKQILNACQNGNLELVQQLSQNNPDIYIFDDIDEDSVFRCACYEGYLHFAQWLLKIKPDIYISDGSECAFILACQNGHLHVAQWLLEVKPTINISTNSEDAFRHACWNKHLQIAQWLCTLKPFKYSIKIKNNKLIYIINYKEKMLFVLYSLTNKGYQNNLNASLVINIFKYL